MTAEKYASSNSEISISKWVKQKNKNKKTPIKKCKQEFMYIHKCNHQKVQQTNNKQAAGSKKTSTHNAANNQEKQKTQTSPNKNKNEIKTHRKKQEPQVIMHINASTKKHNES